MGPWEEVKKAHRKSSKTVYSKCQTGILEGIKKAHGKRSKRHMKRIKRVHAKKSIVYMGQAKRCREGMKRVHENKKRYT